MSTTQRLPGNAVLEMTYCCNHKCLFCSCPWENTSNPSQSYEKHDELGLEEWKRVFHALEASDVMRVSISVGEPLLKDCLVDLLYYIRKHTRLSRDEKIVLISNGEMMSENLLAVFKELDIHLSLSLPGLTMFEYHTGSDTNSPSNVLKWLSLAKESSIDTTVNITVTDKNHHELYETIAKRCFPAGISTSWISLCLSKEVSENLQSFNHPNIPPVSRLLQMQLVDFPCPHQII